MSASLVGSEMCIRDRACTEAETAGEEVKVLRSGAMAAGAMAAGAVAAGAVSYTHLKLPTICSV
eukprot:11815561-Alexandrium_andersonii.AAC.1